MRRALGIPDSLPLPVAVRQANERLQLPGDGPLPQQITALVHALPAIAEPVETVGEADATGFQVDDGDDGGDAMVVVEGYTNPLAPVEAAPAVGMATAIAIAASTEAVAPSCGNGHACVISNNRAGNYQGGWICDTCRRRGTGDRWFCAQCHADLCFSCSPLQLAAAGAGCAAWSIRTCSCRLHLIPLPVENSIASETDWPKWGTGEAAR